MISLSHTYNITQLQNQSKFGLFMIENMFLFVSYSLWSNSSLLCVAHTLLYPPSLYHYIFLYFTCVLHLVFLSLSTVSPPHGLINKRDTKAVVGFFLN